MSHLDYDFPDHSLSTVTGGLAMPRRELLAASASAGMFALAGCLSSPSSGGPPYEIHELDDGPVYEPGLQDEAELAYFATLVTDRDEADAFDLSGQSRAVAREFVAATDFDEQLLGVVQVAGLNSSMVLRVPDVSLSDVNLTVVVSVEDKTPFSDDRVISTLFVRVTRTENRRPNRIAVELSLGEQHRTFSGD
jgi:hypothetical protein